MDGFQESWKAKIAETESVLKSYLPEETGYQKTVIRAMNYSLLAGGKRLRPLLMWETYRMFQGEGEEIRPFLAAIEMIHTYSLVHDDLPAMDDDEYRRGRRTTHAVFGEGMGLLAGDGLLNYAFETALSAFARKRLPEPRLRAVGQALSILAEKSGIYGMIGGQAADLENEGIAGSGMAGRGGMVGGAPAVPENVPERLLFIHGHKTAALIQAAMMIGAVLAAAGEAQVRRMEDCGYYVGLAFQIRDDILDVSGNREELGKPTGSDEKNGKTTYVTVHGMEKAREDVKKLSRKALELLEGTEKDCAFLAELIRQLIDRRK